MMAFFARMVQLAALAMAVSVVSVFTTLVLVAVIAGGLWYVLTSRVEEEDNTVFPPASEKHFQLHEAVVMQQLIRPGDISVTWDDIGGCDDVLRHIQEQVINPLRYAIHHQAEPLLVPPKGVLLYGPPGCGKTLIAKAVACEVKMNFLNVDLSTIKNKWVGETEKMSAAIFSTAYKIQPCVIFLDEVDTFLGTRNGYDGPADAGMKTMFLQMWDGLASDPGAFVLVLAATNRIEAVDDAFLRRLPLQFKINLPTAEGRFIILQIHLRGVPLAEDVDLQAVVARTEGFSGSDLQELCRCASMLRLADYMRQISSGGTSPGHLRDLTQDDLILALEMHRLHPDSLSGPRGLYV